MYLLCLGGSNLILHCYKYSTSYMSLLFGAGFSSTKNMDSGSMIFYFLILHIFEIVCPNFAISAVISSGLIE
jgi:hypothetical protein